jgi:hypothetical protein
MLTDLNVGDKVSHPKRGILTITSVSATGWHQAVDKHGFKFALSPPHTDITKV